MKILIIGFTKIKFMPYLNFYYENLDKKQNEVHILYWNRDLEYENLDKYSDAVFHEFKCFQKDDVGKICKVSGFLKYRKYAKSIIYRKKFDFIIVLHTLPGVLIKSLLIKQYAKRYILDYRDSTFENIGAFKRIVEALVKQSKYTFVSSDGFRQYLPESENDRIITSHNILLDSLKHKEDKEKYGNETDVIRISFWGFIRHKDVNLAIIDRISKDSRFELHYYGREQDTALELKKYAKEIGASNVFFHGEYKPEDRYEFIKHTDLIHNIYYDRNTMLAMGNKYYDGIVFRIPQICMPGSYMGKRATEKGVGIECDPTHIDFCDTIFDYFKKIDFNTFVKSCEQDLHAVLKEYDTGKELIRELGIINDN